MIRQQTATSYLIGFTLSIALTLIAYVLVVRHAFDRTTLLAAIIGFGVIQLFVQLAFFLHLSTNPEERWNARFLAFTVVIIVIVVGGSLWIMNNLNRNMIMSPQQMEQYVQSQSDD